MKTKVTSGWPFCKTGFVSHKKMKRFFRVASTTERNNATLTYRKVTKRMRACALEVNNIMIVKGSDFNSSLNIRLQSILIICGILNNNIFLGGKWRSNCFRSAFLRIEATIVALTPVNSFF